MSWKQKADAAIEAALNLAYTDEQKFIRTVAMEFAVSNMGQDLADCISNHGLTPPPAANLIAYAYQRVAASEGDEVYEAFEEERIGWEKEARKMVPRLKKAGLPLTVANTHLCWEKKGPFAKKVK